MDMSSTYNHKPKTRVVGAIKPAAWIPTSSDGKWREYEAMKREWVALNGYGDPAAYDAMIRRITKYLGI